MVSGIGPNDITAYNTLLTKVEPELKVRIEGGNLTDIEIQEIAKAVLVKKKADGSLSVSKNLGYAVASDPAPFTKEQLDLIRYVCEVPLRIRVAEQKPKRKPLEEPERDEGEKAKKPKGEPNNNEVEDAKEPKIRPMVKIIRKSKKGDDQPIRDVEQRPKRKAEGEPEREEGEITKKPKGEPEQRETVKIIHKSKNQVEDQPEVFEEHNLEQPLVLDPLFVPKHRVGPMKEFNSLSEDQYQALSKKLTPTMIANVLTAGRAGKKGLEGEQFKNTSSYVQTYLQHDNSGTVREDVKLKTLELLTSLAKDSSSYEHINPDNLDQIIQQAERRVDSVNKLNPGETTLLSGGYQAVEGLGGHQVIFRITCTGSKDGKKEYELSIINTGAGIKYHPAALTNVKTGEISETGEPLYKVANKFDPVLRFGPLTDELNLDFFVAMLNYELGAGSKESSVTPTSDELYFTLRRFLGSPNYDVDLRREEDLITGQREGSCAYKPILITVKELLGERANYKRFKHNLELVTMQVACKNLMNGFYKPDDAREVLFYVRGAASNLRESLSKKSAGYDDVPGILVDIENRLNEVEEYLKEVSEIDVVSDKSIESANVFSYDPNLLTARSYNRRHIVIYEFDMNKVSRNGSPPYSAWSPELRLPDLIDWNAVDRPETKDQAIQAISGLSKLWSKKDESEVRRPFGDVRNKTSDTQSTYSASIRSLNATNEGWDNILEQCTKEELLQLMESLETLSKNSRTNIKAVGGLAVTMDLIGLGYRVARAYSKAAGGDFRKYSLGLSYINEIKDVVWNKSEATDSVLYWLDKMASKSEDNNLFKPIKSSYGFTAWNEDKDDPFDDYPVIDYIVKTLEDNWDKAKLLAGGPPSIVLHPDKEKSYQRHVALTMMARVEKNQELWNFGDLQALKTMQTMMSNLLKDFLDRDLGSFAKNAVSYNKYSVNCKLESIYHPISLKDCHYHWLPTFLTDRAYICSTDRPEESRYYIYDSFNDDNNVIQVARDITTENGVIQSYVWDGKEAVKAHNELTIVKGISTFLILNFCVQYPGELVQRYNQIALQEELLKGNELAAICKDQPDMVEQIIKSINTMWKETSGLDRAATQKSLPPRLFLANLVARLMDYFNQNRAMFTESEYQKILSQFDPVWYAQEIEEMDLRGCDFWNINQAAAILTLKTPPEGAPVDVKTVKELSFWRGKLANLYDTKSQRCIGVKAVCDWALDRSFRYIYNHQGLEALGNDLPEQIELISKAEMEGVLSILQPDLVHVKWKGSYPEYSYTAEDGSNFIFDCATKRLEKDGIFVKKLFSDSQGLKEAIEGNKYIQRFMKGNITNVSEKQLKDIGGYFYQFDIESATGNKLTCLIPSDPESINKDKWSKAPPLCIQVNGLWYELPKDMSNVFILTHYYDRDVEGLVLDDNLSIVERIDAGGPQGKVNVGIKRDGINYVLVGKGDDYRELFTENGIPPTFHPERRKIWKDEDSDKLFLEYPEIFGPNYKQLRFSAKNDNNELYLESDPSWKLSKEQHLATLDPASGYMVLEDLKGNRRLLFDTSKLLDCDYFGVELSKDGIPTPKTRKEMLFLATFYMKSRDYASVIELIRASRSDSMPDKVELKVLHYLAYPEVHEGYAKHATAYDIGPFHAAATLCANVEILRLKSCFPTKVWKVAIDEMHLKMNEIWKDYSDEQIRSLCIRNMSKNPNMPAEYRLERLFTLPEKIKFGIYTKGFAKEIPNKFVSKVIDKSDFKCFDKEDDRKRIRNALFLRDRSEGEPAKPIQRGTRITNSNCLEYLHKVWTEWGNLNEYDRELAIGQLASVALYSSEKTTSLKMRIGIGALLTREKKGDNIQKPFFTGSYYSEYFSSNREKQAEDRVNKSLKEYLKKGTDYVMSLKLFSSDINMPRDRESQIGNIPHLVKAERVFVDEQLEQAEDPLEDLQDFVKVEEGAQVLQEEGLFSEQELQEITADRNLSRYEVDFLRKMRDAVDTPKEVSPTYSLNVDDLEAIEELLKDKSPGDEAKIVESTVLDMVNQGESPEDVRGRASGRRRLWDMEMLIPVFLFDRWDCLTNKVPPVSDDEIPTIRELVSKYMQLSCAQKKVDKATELVEKIKKNPDDEKLQAELGKLIKESRTFDINFHPALLVFEYVSGWNIFSHQAKLLSDFFEKDASGKARSLVAQLIMGAGKTDVILLLTALMKADGKNLSVMILPEFSFDTVRANYETQCYERFGIKPVSLQIKREDCSEEYLTAIRDKLKNAILNRTFVITRPEDIACIHLLHWDERLNKSPLAEILREIAQLLRGNVAYTLDEVDSLYSDKWQVCFPISDEVEPNPIETETVNSAFKILFSDDQLRDELQLGKNLQAKATDESRKSAIHKVAKTMIDELPPAFMSAIPLDKEYLLSYALGSNDEFSVLVYEALTEVRKVPRFEKFADKLAVMRKLCSAVLTLTLSTSCFSDHGNSLEHPERGLSIPYAGNNNPCEGAQFRLALLTMANTYLLWSSGPPNQKQTEGFVRYLKEKIMAVRGNPQLFTTLVDRYRGVFGENIQNINPNKNWLVEELHQKLHNFLTSEKFSFEVLNDLFEYVDSHVIGKELKEYIENVNFTPYGLTHGSNSSAASGTQKIFSGPEGCDVSSSVETDREITRRILSCDAKVYTIDEDEDAIDEVAKRIEEGRFIRAFIDVGIRFLGQNNDDVAKRFLQKLKPHGIEGVIYWDPKQNLPSIMAFSGDEIKHVVMQGSSKSEIERACKELKIDASKLFTYYDQRHTVGSDIAHPDKSRAFVYVDVDTQKDPAYQGVMRERGFLDEREQGVDFLITTTLSKQKNIHDAKGIVRHVTQVQAKEELKENASAVFKKMDQIAIGIIDNKIIFSRNEEEANRLFNVLRPLIVNKTPQSRLDRYGGVEEERDIIWVIKNYRDKILGKITDRELKEEVKAALNKFIDEDRMRANLPPKTKVPTGEGADGQVQRLVVQQQQQQQQQQQAQAHEQRPNLFAVTEIIEDPPKFFEQEFNNKYVNNFISIDYACNIEAVEELFGSIVSVSCRFLDTLVSGKPPKEGMKIYELDGLDLKINANKDRDFSNVWGSSRQKNVGMVGVVLEGGMYYLRVLSARETNEWMQSLKDPKQRAVVDRPRDVWLCSSQGIHIDGPLPWSSIPQEERERLEVEIAVLSGDIKALERNKRAFKEWVNSGRPDRKVKIRKFLALSCQRSLKAVEELKTATWLEKILGKI